jgi:hypothetical protein
LEIYNEEIRDLLSKDPKNSLELKENIDSGVYVKDLTQFTVKNASEIDHVMQAGKKNRSVGATLMNATSSRSHSIFTIVVECAQSDERGDHIRVGKLNLVDLAGSERQSKVRCALQRRCKRSVGVVHAIYVMAVWLLMMKRAASPNMRSVFEDCQRATCNHVLRGFPLCHSVRIKSYRSIHICNLIMRQAK